MSRIGQEFNSLLHSNLSCAGDEIVTGRFMDWLSASLAHFAIGGIISAVVVLRGYSVGWFWLFLGLIAVKEVSADIPNSGFSALVMLDSVWDLLCYAAAFFALWSMMMTASEGDLDHG